MNSGENRVDLTNCFCSYLRRFVVVNIQFGFVCVHTSGFSFTCYNLKTTSRPSNIQSTVLTSVNGNCSRGGCGYCPPQVRDVIASLHRQSVVVLRVESSDGYPGAVESGPVWQDFHLVPTRQPPSRSLLLLLLTPGPVRDLWSSSKVVRRIPCHQ